MIRQSAAALAALATFQVAAQVILPPSIDAGAQQQRQIEEERRRREAERELPQPAQPLTRPAAPVAPALPRADAGVRVTVKEIRFTPSQILSAAELEAIAADYRGKQVSLADLQQLADRVNALYKAKGVVTAVATIPQQDVTEGVIEVRLVEGRVGAVKLSGNESTRESYIASRIGAQPGEVVDLNKLEKSLVWFNQTNDIRLQADLQPGSAFGTTDINVAVEEPPRHELLATLDNLGSNLTGEWRGGVSYRNRSLLGWRDELFMSFTGADGQRSGALGYTVPFNPWGGRLSLSQYEDRTEIKHGPLKTLNITGESRATVLGVRQPVWVDSRNQWLLVGGGKDRVSKNFISNFLPQQTDDKDKNLGVEWTWVGTSSVVSASYVSYWVDATTADIQSKHRVDRAWLRWNQALGGDFSLRAFLNGQATGDKNLPSAEQFVLGGDGSVRGYPVGALSGDQGYTASVEVHHPLPTLDLGSLPLASSAFVFTDYGRVEPFRPPDSLLAPSENLTSMGFGFNAALGKNLSGRLIFAWGLDKLPAPNEGSQKKVMFQLVASFL
ncbi:ShlB/FhaC/HecB family hemolysin secretion/activation protein [Variovorax sp. OV329]|uniref:ShlB/FhaC/HecB family hemolysin secretion/activation protein n=1 Tax=Variovorax sp. OV329 TaxID=1882825 RepID=UPI0008E0E268|nr:ShlB/FhaC/HecB family hemolysin secretion/activation protein [Variovorax sp. OV329]SFL89098.1 Hemolysin activation/secretion protein [Variovorax sp. OV329]